MMALRVLAALTLLGFVAAAQAQIELPAQGTLEVNVPTVEIGSATLDSSYFLDVPPGTRKVTLELDGASARDIDLLVRIGTPFPEDLTSINDVFGSAEFTSQSLFTSESIVLADFAVPDLAGTRIFVGVVSFEGQQSTASLSVNASTQTVGNLPILVDFENTPGTANCDIAPWTDPAPFTPVGGNQATTLGEARRNTMLEAARLLSMELYSDVPVTINACWEARGGDTTGATLAGARGRALFSNSPGLPEPDLLYIQSVATRRAGTSLSGLSGGDQTAEADIFITFNTDIDGNVALGNRTFYYGFTPQGPTGNDSDFLSVTLHEITHGVGFAATFNETGRLVFNQPDVFTANLVDNRTGEGISLIDPSVTDAQRLEVATSISGLQWSGPESSVSIRNTDATRDEGFIRMNAPLEYQPGSSVSHIAQNYCELMTANTPGCVDAPFRSLALSRPMLHEVGWAPSPDEPNYLGLMFDRSRDGHGFEFALGGQDADGNDVYVLTFYTFETLGRAPEWFQAVGTIDNGVFSGTRNGDQIGFAQFLYDDSRTPPQQANPGSAGQVVLNFNNPELSNACNDGVGRNGVSSVAVLQFILTNQVDEWCVEPLTLESSRPADDFGGLWFAGEADTGWGFSLENIDNGDGTTTLFVLLYVYAEDGTPVWFFGLDSFSDLSGPLTFEMFQRTGFARLSTFGSVSDESAGSLALTLTQPSNALDAGNRISVDVDYLGLEGGEWVRDDVAIQRLSLPRP
ncbi:MAG: hypothetical protein AAF358_14540 [Pseudomonadota bacterium]